ncbi:MAG TPA: TfoX/Sxy family protein [Solirubrobacteraceae bacterium]|jgi:TfoX/Sxy family transcriptional regulator of competence genes
MAYDEEFAHRIREQLGTLDGVSETAMFGGLAFLLNGNIAVAISSHGELMVRVGVDGAEQALAHEHVRPMQMSGRSMKGWVLVCTEGIRTKPQLRSWVRRGVKFAGTLPAKG